MKHLTQEEKTELNAKIVENLKEIKDEEEAERKLEETLRELQKKYLRVYVTVDRDMIMTRGHDGKMSYLTLDGSVIGCFDDVYMFSPLEYSQSRAIVREGDNYYLIDKKGDKKSIGYSQITRHNKGQVFGVERKDDDGNWASVYIDVDDNVLTLVERVEAIGSRKDTLHIFSCNGRYYFRTGCFFGDLEEFEGAVEFTYSNFAVYENAKQHYTDYMRVVKRYKEKMAIAK